MKKNIRLLIELFLILSIGLFCNSSRKSERLNVVESNNSVCFEFNPEIEIWNKEGDEYSIGNWYKLEEKYVKSEGWNATDYPYPKKFDIKLLLVNNSILYGEPPFDLDDWRLSVDLAFKVGQNKDALYPLNSKIIDRVNIIERLVTASDFSTETGYKDTIHIWSRGIELESNYVEYQRSNIFINQLIFEIQLKNSSNDKCVFQYNFMMRERGEI